MEINLEERAAELAEAVGRAKDEVLQELLSYIEQGYSPAGAIVKWKRDNRFQLGAGLEEYIGRLIAVEEPHPVSFEDRETVAATLHFAIRDSDTGKLIFKQATLWGEDRINDVLGILDYNKVYRFKAAEKADGTLIRLRDFEEVDDKLIPAIDEIEPLPFDQITLALGQHELIRGWIGEVIRIGDEPVGFEVGDPFSAEPNLVVWFGGQWSRIPRERIIEISSYGVGDEVVCYGFISKSGPDIRMNARNIFKVG